MTTLPRVPNERDQRIAESEIRFRQINEELTESLREIPGDSDALVVVCECGARDCAQTVTVPDVVYEAVRGNPRRLVVAPGHELLDVETVIERAEGYVLVEKHEETAGLVEETDPRQGEG